MIGSFRLPISVTSSVDTTAPTILTAKVEDANPDKLVVVFSEVVTITDITGLTITGAVTPTLSTPTGSGSNTITFTLSAALTNGQSVTLNVSSNTIKDAANNSLAATTRAITNNVAASATYDSDYQAVLDTVVAAGDALPSTAQQDIDNQIMIDYKAAGGWAKDDAVFKFKGVGFGSGLIGYRLMDWKRLIKANAYGSLVWSDSGVKGNGANAYIDPLFILSSGTTFTQDDACYAFSLFDSGTAGNKALLGLNVGSGFATEYLSPNTAGSNYCSINSDTQLSNVIRYDFIGYTSVNRTIGSNVSIKHTTTTSYTKASLPRTNYTPYLFARNRVDNSTVDSFSDAGISFFSIGGSKLSEHDAIKTVIESI